MSLIGQQIGDWNIQKKLGEGGMSVVYLGQHVWLGTTGAVKVLHPTLNQRTQQLKRFQREAHLASQLNHDNIIQIRDFSHDKRHGFFMVLEYLEGQELEAWVQRAPLPKHWILAIMSQVCEGLHAIHNAGIIHRDLKPSNIFLLPNDPYPLVKILDFGIAKTPQLDQLGKHDKLTKTDAILGTPAYLAPEQARSGNEITPQTDLYSLGVLLYELFTGQLPIRDTNLLEHLLKLIQQAPPPMGAHRLELRGSALEQCVAQMLSKDPKTRPSSARAAWKMLQDAAEVFFDPLDDRPFPELPQSPTTSPSEEESTDENDAAAIDQTNPNPIPPPSINLGQTAPHPPPALTQQTAHNAPKETVLEAFEDGEVPLPPLDIPDTVRGPLPTSSNTFEPTTQPEGLPTPSVDARQDQTTTPNGGLWSRWWLICAAVIACLVLIAVLFRGKHHPTNHKRAATGALQRLFQEGQNAYQQRRYAKAIQSWKRAIQLSGWRQSRHYPGLYKSLGDAMRARGHEYSSLAFYKRYATHLPPRDAMAIQAAKQLIAALETNVKLKISQTKSWMQLLQQQTEQQRWEQAHQTFLKMTRRAPSLPSLHLELARTLRHFPHTGLALVNRALKEFVLTTKERGGFQTLQIRLQQRLMQLDQARKDSIAKSRKLAKQGKWKQAWKYLTQQLRNDTQLTQKRTHKAFRDQLRWTVSQGKYKQASALLEQYRNLLMTFVKRGLYDWLSGDKSNFPSQREVLDQANALRHFKQAKQQWQIAQRLLQLGIWRKASRALAKAHRQWVEAEQRDKWKLAKASRNPIASPKASQWVASLEALARQWPRTQRLVRRAQLKASIRALKRHLRQLPHIPPTQRWRQKIKRRIYRLRRARKQLAKANALMQQKQWRSAEAILLAHKRAFPRAWDLRALKEKIHLCRCGYGGVTWKLCKKQRFQR